MAFSYFQDDNAYNQIVKTFENSYSFDDLRCIKKSLKPFFIQYLTARNTDSEVLDLVYSIYSASSSTRKKFAELIALIFISRENFITYFQWLPPSIQKVWKDVIKENGISSQELIIRYNVYIPGINHPDFIMKRDILPALCFFSFDLYYNNTLDFIEKIAMYYFYLPPKIHSLVIPLFYQPQEYELILLDTLPEKNKLLVYENKQEILSNIPVIKGVEQQGYIVLNIKGNVNLTTVVTVERKMEMSEFFDSVMREVSVIRGFLILTLYTKYKFSESQTDIPEKYIKNIFLNLLPNDFGWIIPSLLHHIKGYRDLHKQKNPGAEQYSQIIKYIRDLPLGKWMSLENLLMYCKYKEINLCPLSETYLGKDYLRFRNEIILKDKYYSLITIPFVKAILFMLAAFGVIDIAYGDYSLSFDSYYESLRYFRITELGEYILGKKQVFLRATDGTEKHYFEADENNLIIRSLEPDNIYEKLLMEMAVPISKTRFKVTHISFLRSCKTAVDIENKINFFRLFICHNPSKIWEEFFESVKKRVNPLAEVKSNFKLFKLDATNTELIRLIAQDPQIKKYVLKVENHHMLIKNQDISKVVERLKTYGYLL